MSARVSLACDDGVSLAIPEDELSRIFDHVLAAEGVGRPCEVSVSVVDEARMQGVNAEWRGVEAPTDVISLECERPDDPDLAPGEPCELGDIFMAPAVLARQARQFGTTAADETRLMAIHSLLHLLGYDHIEEDDARVMEAREDELLAEVVGRALGHVELTRHRDDAPLSRPGEGGRP